MRCWPPPKRPMPKKMRSTARIGTVTSLFLRGTSSTQTLVLVDGVPLNSPYFGGTDLSALSVANVERVEVVRGPFSALYGSEAIGGVVRGFTRRGAAQGEGSE